MNPKSVRTFTLITLGTLLLCFGASEASAKGSSGRAASYGSRSGVRPYYGGGYHTKSHGGTYIGGHGSSHAGGHYMNPKSDNRYGIHAPTIGEKGGYSLKSR